jgi:disulfide bond formation protein DsbB
MSETSKAVPSAAAAQARSLVAVAFLAPSLIALATALAAEYVFGVVGCDLCVLERYPYAATAVIAAAACLRWTPAVLRAAAALCSVLFALGCGLSVYHVGIQQGWWSEIGLCAGALPASPIDLRTLTAQQRPACDQVDWSILGLSLAALNALYAAALAVAAAVLSVCGVSVLSSRAGDGR